MILPCYTIQFDGGDVENVAIEDVAEPPPRGYWTVLSS